MTNKDEKSGYLGFQNTHRNTELFLITTLLNLIFTIQQAGHLSIIRFTLDRIL